MSSLNIEVTSTAVPSQIEGSDKGVYQSYREGAKPVAADGNLEEKVMKKKPWEKCIRPCQATES